MQAMVLTSSLPIGNSKFARRGRQLLKQIKGVGYQTHLVSLLNSSQKAEDAAQLEGFCSQVHVFESSAPVKSVKLLGEPGWPHSTMALQGLLRKIDELWEGCGLVALVDATGWPVVSSKVESGGHRPRVLIDLAEPLSERLRLCARSSRRPMRWLYRYQAKQTRKLEQQAVLGADLALVSGEADRGRLISRVTTSLNRRRVSSKVWTIGDGVVIPDESSTKFIASESPTILFRGNLNIYAHKREALWLIRKVLPKVRQAIPDATLRFVAGDAPGLLSRLQGFEGVECFDMKKDSMRAMVALRQSTIGVAPQRDARGAVDPVLTILASGRPVVATETISMSLPGDASMALICARKEEGFAGQIVKLLKNRSRAQQVGDRARKIVSATGTWEALWQPVSGWLGEQASRREAA